LNSHSYKNLEYIQKGSSPTLLFLSGMHGDEYESIQLVTDYIQKNADTLPDFLYIPNVSPSAVSLKSRTNQFGHDINRTFYEHPADEEAKACIELLKQYQFTHCFDFHEDLDFSDSFYMYDTGNLSKKNLRKYYSTLKNLEIEPFTGLDDPNDNVLGFEIVKGYVSYAETLKSRQSGFLSAWLTRHKIAYRVMTFEIPGKSTLMTKKALVYSLFTFFIPLIS